MIRKVTYPNKPWLCVNCGTKIEKHEEFAVKKTQVNLNKDDDVIEFLCNGCTLMFYTFNYNSLVEVIEDEESKMPMDNFKVVR